MRKAAFTAALLAIMISIPVLFIPEAGADSDDRIRVKLDIELTEKDQGKLLFTIKAGEEENVDLSEGLPADTGPYINENMGRVLKALRMGGTDEKQLMRSIFRNNGDLELIGPEIRSVSNRQCFVLKFTTRFSYNTSGIDAEYSYLDFIYRVDDLFKQSSGGISGIAESLAKERELRRIGIDILIEGGSDLSYSTSKIVSDHSRTFDGESVSEHTNAQEFLRSSNDVKVFDRPLLMPSSIFISMFLLLLIGYGSLLYIWNRERFAGLGLIVPIITLIFPVLLIWTYYSPELAFYDLGGGTIWVFGCIFLILVGVCNLFNPRSRYRSFEDEKKEEPRTEMPDVIVVNKRVYIDRPVRITDEEALDPYKVLDIRRKASWDEVEIAYKKKVKEYHPDKFLHSPKRIHKAAKEETERLNIAYEKLRRKHRR